MIKIGLLSDTHGFIHPKVSDFYKDVDEIWHAGDIGNLETAKELVSRRLIQLVVSLPKTTFLYEGDIKTKLQKRASRLQNEGSL